MKVELDIFSGRVNPSWVLTPEQASEFCDRLRRLQRTASARAISTGLGYRGFSLHDDSGCCDGWQRIRVYGEHVAAEAAGRVESRADPERSIELWLRDLAAAHIDPALLTHVPK